MAQTISVPNGPPTLELEECVIGSQIRVAMQFEQLVEGTTDTFEPMDFTNMVLKAEVKDKPSKDVIADAEFECLARGVDGWVDMTLDGEATGALSPRRYEASLKVWPTGHPEQGDTIFVIGLPMKYRSTR